ncbi:MAG: alpha/beta hydrolase, partial [Nitrospinaceae bacterium]|nr:alpha/beta hydrolase [Nitrospinaceae bacterium]
MAVNAKRKREWFTAFPKDYRWSFITSISLQRVSGGAANTSEIFEICRRLKGKDGDDKAWVREWTRMGDRLREMGQAAQRKKNLYSAADFYNRACNYYQAADRFMFPKNAKSKALYRKSIDCFHRYVTLTDSPRTEIVEIPFEGKKKLPAYFVHAQNTKKAKPPVVVQYTGFDGTKEGGFSMATLELVRRGMSVVVPDTPGVGEAIRFRGIYLRHDYEVAGTAILNWLEKRKDVRERSQTAFPLETGLNLTCLATAQQPLQPLVLQIDAISPFLFINCSVHCSTDLCLHNHSNNRECVQRLHITPLNFVPPSTLTRTRPRTPFSSSVCATASFIS